MKGVARRDLTHSRAVGHPVKLCVYCGEKPATEREHVIAKQCFSEPRPPDLITVPSCPDCNDRFKPHEDYMRAHLAANLEAITKNRSARRLHDGKLMRSFQKDHAIAKLLKRDIVWRPVRTPAGLFLGLAAVLNMDLNRAKVVCEKIVRGLYYHVHGKRLPAGYEVQLQSQITDDQLRTLAVLFEGKKRTWKCLGEGVFTYVTFTTVEDTGLTLWIATFYDTFHFVARTGRPEQLYSPQ